MAKREILIYDEIGPDDYGYVGVQSVMEQLNALGRGDVTVRINSPGGAGDHGMAIYNALQRHDGNIHVIVDAIAASAASIVAMAGKTIEMAAASFMMIHNSWTFAAGDAGYLRSTADLLDKFDGIQINTFAARSKQSPEQIKQWLDAETWMTAEEAVARGFADRIGQAFNGVAASIAHDRFRNVPPSLSHRIGAKITQDTIAARAARRKLAIARARANA